MPSGFRFTDWPLYLKDELVFVSQFFLLNPEFKEPFRKLKPKETENYIPGMSATKGVVVDYIP